VVYLTRTARVVIVLTALLVSVVRPVHAYQARAERGEVLTFYMGDTGDTGDTDQAGDTALVCLVLVLGTALLAVGVWVGKLRRTLS
jgi:hypothetical protein